MPSDRRSKKVNGKMKLNSHYVWHQNTGHWPIKGEVIHHIDDDPLNDDFDNLQLKTKSAHSSYHKTGERSHWYGKSSKERKRRIT